MERFVHRYADRITGVLSGFDRLVFRGTLRQLVYGDGLKAFLWHRQVLLKEFGDFALALTDRLKTAVRGAAEALGRPVKHLLSPRTRKEDVARAIAERDGITEGLIAVLTAVEPCQSWEIYRNRETRRLEPRPARRKCLFLYQYWQHPRFGLCYARIQTWLPFHLQVGLNGRTWLAGQLDRAGIAYERRENCFPWVADVPAAQRLLDRQLTTAWPRALSWFARRANPLHRAFFGALPIPLDYYWTTRQSEWATDVMFRDAPALAEIYPALVRHGIATFGSADVMRFLGHKVHGAFRGEIVSDFKDRPEGVRIRHAASGNAVKAYDKQGRILRVETTVNDPTRWKVWRPAQGQPDGPKAWRPMRRGVADLHRRAEVSQAANERYLDALASVDTATPLGTLTRDVCQATTWHGGRVRGLRPFVEEDRRLFQAVSRGEYALTGFRNGDLQAHLFDGPAPTDARDRRRRSARVTRQLRMLRAHGLIKKLGRSRRYSVTPKGRDLMAAFLACHDVTLAQLNHAAA